MRFRLMLLLLLAAAILGAAAWLRGGEYDEGYTAFLSAGTPRPDWPRVPMRAEQLQLAFAGASTIGGLAEDLRRTDVHPPLYFWAVAAWRGVAGTDLLATRAFSVLCALASLALVWALARRAQVPAGAAMLLTLGSYAFAYTGIIARGFALAQVLLLAGALALLGARGAGRAAAGGLLLGAAAFANYLAAFVAAAALAWRFLAAPRAWRLWLPAGLGFAAFLPPLLYFYLAQRDSRPDQFPAFELVPALMRLAQYAAATVLGGLPLYVPEGWPRAAMAALCALVLAAVGLAVLWRWRRLGTRDARWLFLLCAAAPPLGLIALGLVFGTAPIELRYLAFATPFLALLAAGALGWRARAGLLALQAVALAGLALHPATMQPHRAAMRDVARLAGADGLALVPFGNDGVGMAGAAIREAPPGLTLLVVRRSMTAEDLRAAAAPFPRMVASLAVGDGESRAMQPRTVAAFDGNPCWRRGGEAPLAISWINQCRS
jgi:hypothetical protein